MRNDDNNHYLQDPWPRIAGVLYLITIVTGLFAQVFVRGSVIVRDDAAATASNILANEFWYRSGLAFDLVMLVSYVGVTVLFYELFKPVSRMLSMLAAFFSMVGIIVLAINCLNHYAPLVFLGGSSYLSGFDSSQLNAMSRTALRLHGAGFTISGVFFGVYCMLIGGLAFTSGFIPRTVAVLMALGGAGFLVSSFITILLPALDSRLPDIALLGGIGELSLTLWLIVMGVSGVKSKPR